MTGVRHLLRLAWRRDRWMVLATLALAWVLAYTSAVSTIDLYPDTAARVQSAEMANGLSTVVMTYGWVYEPTSVAGLGGTKLQMIEFIIVAFLAIAIVRRHTRADEESGRSELLATAVIGRAAPLAAAVGFAGLISLVAGAGIALAVGAGGFPWAGSWLVGAASAGIGIVFAVVTGIAMQLSASSRTCSGVTYGALAVAYVLRLVGDVREGESGEFLRWLSPFGWGQQVRAWNGDRAWVLTLFVGLAVVGYLAAARLRATRDLGSGLVPERPGPDTGRINGSFGLAWRLHRGGLLGWLVAGVALGLVSGALIGTVGGFLDDAAQQLLRQIGGRGIADELFTSVYAGIAAIVASALGISAVLRAREEEVEGHAEAVLATRETRLRFLASHVPYGFGGSLAFLVALGAAQVVAWTPSADSTVTAADAFATAMVQVPAVWSVVALAVLVVGLLPRFPWVAWAAFVLFIAVGELGELLDLPDWVRNISPYAHTPAMPAEPFEAAPVLVLLGVALALAVVGMVGFRRRDLSA